MRYFPIFVDLDRQPVLVVGGGETATQKVRLLLKSDAVIQIVAPSLNAELAALHGAGKIQWRAVAFDSRMLTGQRLVYAASDDPGLDARVSLAARVRSIPVNAVDQPQFCTFITPAIVDRDPVTVAISTEGTAPVLGRQIKSKIEAMLPAAIGGLAVYAQSWRKRVGALIENGRQRRYFWDGFFNGPIAAAYLAGHDQDLDAKTEALLDEFSIPDDTPGTVTLVGAGPGDPDLLTFKAMRALQEADVIVADRLAGTAILEIARRDAKRIDVGKKPGVSSIKQDEINRILLREARAGQKVVRLKGGDPMIFARGAEELEFLHAHGIQTTIVPGISAALACAAAVQLPLTSRDARRSLTLLTGHASDGAAEHDWAQLAAAGQMLAIYMGVGAAGNIQSKLLAAGIDPATLVTIVENGALPAQKTALTTIANLVESIIDAAIKGPAIIYVGAHPVTAPAVPIEPNSAERSLPMHRFSTVQQRYTEITHP